jgi:hypothetical protein
MNPQELKKTISHGLLSFPLTDFDANLKFAPKTIRGAPRMAHALRRDCAVRRRRYR